MKLPAFLTGGANNYWQETTATWGKEKLFPAPPAREDAIDLTSNDYLGLGSTPELIAIKSEAVRTAKDNALMSPAFLPETSVQHAFERQLAEFMGYAACVLTQSGWDANLCVMGLAASLTPKHPVYIDSRAHASFHAGIQLCGNLSYTWGHCDVQQLEELHRQYGPGWITVDSVYSTDGAMPPLRDIVRIAQHYGSVLVVDEAHALGIRGLQGHGLCHGIFKHDGVATFATVSTSKSFSTRGGAVLLPDASLVNCQRFASGHRPGPGIFSSAVQGHEAMSMAGALQLVRGAEERRSNLLSHAALLRSRLAEAGYQAPGPDDSPIVPLVVGNAERALILRRELALQGVTGSVFAPPAVSSRRSMVRLTLNASLTTEHIMLAAQRIISALKAVGGAQ